MRRIGLTGGIATGKSTVARLLEERHGLPVLDADRYAREALAPGTAATMAVLRRYGARVTPRSTPFGEDPNCLDRAALARIVFADLQERQWLEQLVHPIVRGRFALAMADLASAPAIVLMIPLLFEAGLETLCSEIWLVDCGSEEEQIRRLMARDGISHPEAQARLQAQWPMAAKRERADVILLNSGPPSALADQVALALAQRAEEPISASVLPSGAPTVPDAPPID